MYQDQLGHSGEMPSPDGLLGDVVGIPVGIAVCVGIAFLLWRMLEISGGTVAPLLARVPFVVALLAYFLVGAITVGSGIYLLVRTMDWLGD